MKVRIVKTNGTSWDFNTVTEANKHIKKDRVKDYDTREENGEKIRVYDDREMNY